MLFYNNIKAILGSTISNCITQFYSIPIHTIFETQIRTRYNITFPEERGLGFESWIQETILSKIHLPPLLPYPLQMTGVVEKIADPSAIAMMKTINSGGVLGNIPEMRVVQPQQGADQHFQNYTVGDQSHCLLGVECNDLLHSLHGPGADRCQPLTSWKDNLMGCLLPLPIEIGISLLDLFKRLPLPPSEMKIDESLYNLDLYRVKTGNGLGSLLGPGERTGKDGLDPLPLQPLSNQQGLLSPHLIEGHILMTPEYLLFVPARAAMAHQKERGHRSCNPLLIFIPSKRFCNYSPAITPSWVTAPVMRSRGVQSK